MLLALVSGLVVQAATPVVPPTAFTPPTLSAEFRAQEPALRYDAMAPVSRDVYGEGGWFLTGLALCGGGIVVMGLSGAGSAATEVPAIDRVFGWTGLFGALHFVVGASMIGLELTEGRSARVVWTGTGVAGRF
jgi:hypothetical protein